MLWPMVSPSPSSRGCNDLAPVSLAVIDIILKPAAAALHKVLFKMSHFWTSCRHRPVTLTGIDEPITGAVNDHSV